MNVCKKLEFSIWSICEEGLGLPESTIQVLHSSAGSVPSHYILDYVGKASQGRRINWAKVDSGLVCKRKTMLFKRLA
jgi:hypothetical protein